MESDVREEEKITKIQKTLHDNFMQYGESFALKRKNYFYAPAFSMATVPQVALRPANRQMEILITENKCTLAFIRSSLEDLPKNEETQHPIIVKTMMGAWRRTI